MSDIEEHDGRTQRCRRLGHDISFRYCRTQEGERLCAHILNCWWERFDVADFIEEHYGREAVERLQARAPRPKMASLIDLIQKAQKRAAEAEEDRPE